MHAATCDISKVQETVTTHVRDCESVPKSALGNLRGCRQPLFKQAANSFRPGQKGSKR